MIFGIVGYGRFGRLWAEALASYGKVLVYDKNPIPAIDHPDIKTGQLAEVVQANIVFILVPISQFEASCVEISHFLKPTTLLIDCCSVKIYPVNVMQKMFPKQQPLVATHPLFGPDSVQKKGGIAGHKIVICPIRCNDNKLNQLTNLLKQMGLNLLITTPEEHDKQMASSQGLVHFIGRGLAALNLHNQELATPDFQALLNINRMVIHDSWQLFLDMHKYNPYASDIRQKLIIELQKINEEVNHVNNQTIKD